jgi:hypothetical protein
MGRYTKVANLMQGGRPVYQRVGSSEVYVFYWPNSSSWRIGGNYTIGTRLLGVRSTGSACAACPDQATGWLAYSNTSGWVSTYPITVVPSAVGKLPRPHAVRTSTLALGVGGCFAR